MYGQYIFGDFNSGRVFSFDPMAALLGDLVLTEWDLMIDGFDGLLNRLVAFGLDSEGGLYASTLYGSVFKVTSLTMAAPVPLPASLPLLGGGVFLLIGMRRKRR